MKRIVTLVIVGALILGLIIPNVISAKVNPGQGQSPQLSPHDQTVLHIIAENQTLAQGEKLLSEWIDVSSYRVFKLYARQEQASWESPEVRVWMKETALSAIEGKYGDKIAQPDWYDGDADEGIWTMAYEFSGLFSKIVVTAKNYSDNTSANIHLYLLMAKE